MNRAVLIAIIAIIGIIWFSAIANAFAPSTGGGGWGVPIIIGGGSWDRGGWDRGTTTNPSTNGPSSSSSRSSGGSIRSGGIKGGSGGK